MAWRAIPWRRTSPPESAGTRLRILLCSAHGTDKRGPSGVNILDGFFAQATRQPGALALVAGAHRLTYGELLEHAHSLASALAREGVRQGDTVAMVVVGPVPQLCAVLGLAWLGARSISAPPGEVQVAAL